MVAINDLRHILSIKRFIIFFAVNLINDTVSLSNALNLNQNEITDSVLYYLFDRFFVRI